MIKNIISILLIVTGIGLLRDFESLRTQDLFAFLLIMIGLYIK